jgi:hypothetical protein
MASELVDEVKAKMGKIETESWKNAKKEKPVLIIPVNRGFNKTN